jgi:anti-sigma-K factor RskA
VTCEERADLLLLLAFGELEADEAGPLRAHLAEGCPRCLGALAEAQAIAARLALAIEPVDAPETVRRALAARVALESRVADLPAARPPRRSLARTALAAGLAAVVAAGVTAFATRSRVVRAEREATTRHAALDVIGSPYMRAIRLSGPALGFQGNGHLYWDYHSGGCYLRATEVQRPGPGQVYVLWFTDSDGAPLRAGVIQVSRDGEATLLTEMPREIDTTGPVSVTIEANPTTERPSAQPVLHGEMQDF